jgi:hypothetical protein
VVQEWEEDGMSSVRRVTKSGAVHWLNEGGQLHREDGPAAIERDGSMWWYQSRVLHREGGPAIMQPNGLMYWYRDGRPHLKRMK